MPLEQRQEIQALKEEKQQLETEVEKWNDNTNELIVLAKDMGMMLVEMSDFTRSFGIFSLDILVDGGLLTLW